MASNHCVWGQKQKKEKVYLFLNATSVIFHLKKIFFYIRETMPYIFFLFILPILPHVYEKLLSLYNTPSFKYHSHPPFVNL